MAVRAWGLLVGLLLLLLAFPAATALEVSISDLPQTPPEMGRGETLPLQFGVQLASGADESIVCTQDAAIVVHLRPAAVDAGAGLNASVDPEELRFTIQQGAYLADVNDPWVSDVKSGTFTVHIGDAAPASLTRHEFGLTASFDGSIPSECQGEFAADEETAPVAVTVRPDLPERPGRNTTAAAGTTDGTSAPREGAAPGLFVGVGVILLVAALRRRRPPQP